MDNYQTYIFDCDGVLLDSNNIKTEAFYEVALPYGKDKAEMLTEYHRREGGISRFEKFRYFFAEILMAENYQAKLEAAIVQYGELVRQKLLSCPTTEMLVEFLQSLPSEACKIVVSGGMQDELRQVFAQRKLDTYFHYIFGSPDDKLKIIQRETDIGTIRFPAVFFGDSKYDYRCACQYGIDFVFLSQYTEFADWPNYFYEHSEVKVVTNFKELF
ncbi:MAG: HAD family hydrolase [Acidobacteriota bacterium]